MSVYHPRLEELRVERDARGWWVRDRHGRIDGPYETSFVARATFHVEAELDHQENPR